MWLSRLFGAAAPVLPPATPPFAPPSDTPPAAAPPATPTMAAVESRLRSIAAAHSDRDVLMNKNGADVDMCCLPVGPYKTEEEIIEAVRDWASKSEPNGGGFGIFKESKKPAVKTKGPR